MGCDLPDKMLSPMKKKVRCSEKIEKKKKTPEGLMNGFSYTLPGGGANPRGYFVFGLRIKPQPFV